MTRPLPPHDLATVRAWLDLTDAPVVNTALARRLLATLDQRTAEADAAWALLVADLAPDHPPTTGT
jgi:hypothetical protein